MHRKGGIYSPTISKKLTPFRRRRRRRRCQRLLMITFYLCLQIANALAQINAIGPSAQLPPI